VAGRQAQGIVSGGSGTCSGTTFFKPIDKVLSATGSR